MASTNSAVDRYGLTMSTSSQDAADRYIQGLDIALAQGYGPEPELEAAIEADEGFALAYAGLAMMQMMRMAAPMAKETIQRAQELQEGISRREQQQFQIINLWINGEGYKSTALLREHLAEFPLDSLMVRMAQRLYIRGCSTVGAGESNFPTPYYALLNSIAPAYGEDWAFYGQYAWANHETGRIDEGMRLAQRSLELRPDNAVAAHSIAHVYFETGDPSSGSDFLGPWLGLFDKRAAYRVHLGWHQALFELALGHQSEVISWYNAEIDAQVKDGKLASMVEAASLLWRMQIYSGAQPALPWDEVCVLAAPASERVGVAFGDAHAALALAGSGNEAALGKMIDGLRAEGERGNALAGEVMLPLALGLNAFAQEDYREAVQHLGPLEGQVVRIGGSHAQREVFEDTILEAYLRAGDLDSAEAMLQKRLSQRTTVRDTFWQGRLEAGRGRFDAANDCCQRAQAGWKDADPEFPELASLKSLATQ